MAVLLDTHAFLWFVAGDARSHCASNMRLAVA